VCGVVCCVVGMGVGARVGVGRQGAGPSSRLRAGRRRGWPLSAASAWQHPRRHTRQCARRPLPAAPSLPPQVVVVEAIRSLALKFPGKQRALMAFLAGALREEGGFDYKKAIVASILQLIQVRRRACWGEAGGAVQEGGLLRGVPCSRAEQLRGACLLRPPRSAAHTGSMPLPRPRRQPEPPAARQPSHTPAPPPEILSTRRRSPTPRRRAWRTCASSSRTASSRSCPARSCISWGARGPPPRTPHGEGRTQGQAGRGRGAGRAGCGRKSLKERVHLGTSQGRSPVFEHASPNRNPPPPPPPAPAPATYASSSTA
jgi:hypothetical protein